ncbi:MAG: aminomethyl-transferring glycine dehydrogenase subunit GcvPB [Bacilli bacterium]|jgi:glycine dehydrogenase subunit 2|nr:aminomethyl-transferring glycine dehydrogenase subunit GcvPB [Acholeplasmataceae bacterium]
MYNKLIFEISKPGRIGYSLPKTEVPSFDLPNELSREEELLMPEVSELDVIRHFTNLSKKNYGVDQGFYPLGSCTMKYNPKINEEVARNANFASIHPLQPPTTVQGALEVYATLSDYLSELTGMSAFTFNGFAGAHGELIGLMIMKEYHMKRNDTKRTKIIVPLSAHGTNPASSALVDFEIIGIKTNEKGLVDLDELKSVMSDEVAGMMLTNPNTLGLFETDILEISKVVHEYGGLMYYDGANLNALLGLVRPQDMGFDIIHLNLHKTFSTPHGGGGPGAGPVGVNADLVDFLPNPQVRKVNGQFELFYNPQSIGSVSGFYGNFLVVLRAFAYLLTLGKENVAQVAKYAVLNANYIKEKLKGHYKLPIDDNFMHEVVFDGLISEKATTLDVAKRLLDYGYHPPTIYFPLLFHQSLMIEPTEVESKETLDAFIEAMIKIAEEAETDVELLKTAPHHTVVRRLDEVTAARNPILKYRDTLND